MERQMPAALAEKPATPILVKRYARNRFYDTASARYITLDELRQWRREQVAFTVRDAETGDDITAALLA
jgi:polyhydroxyalkanoate synthesis regulator protein